MADDSMRVDGQPNVCRMKEFLVFHVEVLPSLDFVLCLGFLLLRKTRLLFQMAILRTVILSIQKVAASIQVGCRDEATFQGLSQLI